MENVIYFNQEFEVKYNNITHFCRIVSDSSAYVDIEIRVLKTIKFLWWEKTVKKTIIHDATSYVDVTPIRKQLKFDQNDIIEVCKKVLQFYYLLRGEFNQEKILIDLDN